MQRLFTAAARGGATPLRNTAGQQVRHFARKQNVIRVEEKLGVGLRYRRPRVWDGKPRTSDGGHAVYSTEQIKLWRERFALPQMQHSLGTPSYSDEELLEWRYQFDKYATGSDGKEMINLSSFQKLVADKYKSLPGENKILEAKEIPSKVMSIWGKFDTDGNNFIDFGEFLKASFKFDCNRLREAVKANGGVKGAFDKYANDGFITEEDVFSMMNDYRFTLATTSDMRKLIGHMDADNDGMVSEQDLDKWLALDDF